MPCDYSKYAPNWKTEIRPAILKRAMNHCEGCGVENHIFICRWKGNTAVYSVVPDAICAGWERRPGRKPKWRPERNDWRDPIFVVLTIAHLDHDITNNDPKNLAALCQRCHNRHDAQHRAETRRAKR